jgi:hypothetical protein
MKSTKLLSVLVFLMLFLTCNAQTGKKETAKAKATDKIEVYYFHFTARCVTCKAVEAEAKADIENLYGKKASFQALNLDEAAGKTLAEKLKVSGQTLLVIKNGKQLNLTNEGFMYARTNPEKFKAVIKEKVDNL